MNTDNQPFEEKYITSQDNLKLYYRDYGDKNSLKTPILCLAGLTRNSKDFHRVASWLSHDRRVICPDYRGRGKSDYDPNWKNYTANVYVHDIAQLLIACNIKKVVVIGTSMGGLLSLGLNIYKPRLMEACVINDIGPEIADTGLGRIMNYIGKDKPYTSHEAAIDHLRVLFPYMELLSKADWEEFSENTFKIGADGFLHYDWDVNIAKALQTETGKMPNLWALFRAVRKMPILVIRGGVSDLLSEETVNRMHDAHPNMSSVVVPNVGHAPTLNERQSRDAIKAFLNYSESPKASIMKKIFGAFKVHSA